MTENFWSENTPRNFWLSQPELIEEVWVEAMRRTFPVLGLPHKIDDIDTALKLTLGEAQFGSDHWQISRTKRLYYSLKPFLSRKIINAIKMINSYFSNNTFPLSWPIESRFAQFQWEVIKQILIIMNWPSIAFRHFWPSGEKFALVLTHDVETVEGQAWIREIADLEEGLGFRSLFNFVPEGYDLDLDLMDELRERGFEIGVHGVKHDGKLFCSQAKFNKRISRINKYLMEFGAVGFRSPLTHRHPEWMQALDIGYDLSFFDTDPYEPIPGGCMSIWPYWIGNFLELPYTLIQDWTLSIILKESTPQIWLNKLKFIEQYYGMALVITHPDYLVEPRLWDIYTKFLLILKERDDYWHALPREVAIWWRERADSRSEQGSRKFSMGEVVLVDNDIEIH